ncbi:MAG: hypothetical protein JSV84_04180 [Gemmatimonadota bacterium]|nr:MAG: hypothetical protein JSV84_04180 [Gemmatimonadota bacterium]
MEKHVTLVAAIYIGFGALCILIGMSVFVAAVGGGILSGDPQAMALTSTVGTTIAGFFIVLSVPEIIGSLGLLKRKSWARILVLILAATDLIFIPIGTAIGVYSIWVLLHDETVRLFSQRSES